MSARRLDASALRDWAHTAVGDLISHTDEINRLNVFPVADADTGTNMLFTMRSAWAQAEMQSDTRRRERRSPPRWPPAPCTAPAATPASSFRRSCAASPTWSRPPPQTATVRWQISTAAFSRRPCGTRSGWSSRRWASRCRAPSSRCCRTRRAPPSMRAPTAPTSPKWCPLPPTPRPSHSTRPPGSSMCWPRPAWWTPEAAACWYCWTR